MSFCAKKLHDFLSFALKKILCGKCPFYAWKDLCFSSGFIKGPTFYVSVQKNPKWVKRSMIFFMWLSCKKIFICLSAKGPRMLFLCVKRSIILSDYAQKGPEFSFLHLKRSITFFVGVKLMSDFIWLHAKRSEMSM